jgi:hypothetical protein
MCAVRRTGPCRAGATTAGTSGSTINGFIGCAATGFFGGTAGRFAAANGTASGSESCSGGTKDGFGGVARRGKA